jgi:hypothetical protein
MCVQFYFVLYIKKSQFASYTRLQHMCIQFFALYVKMPGTIVYVVSTCHDIQLYNTNERIQFCFFVFHYCIHIRCFILFPNGDRVTRRAAVMCLYVSPFAWYILLIAYIFIANIILYSFEFWGQWETWYWLFHTF